MPKIIKNPEDRILQAARKRLLDKELSSFSLMIISIYAANKSLDAVLSVNHRSPCPT